MPQDITKIVDEIASWATDRITAYAAASKETLGKVADGDYTGDELSSDLSAAWARLAEDVVSFMKLVPGIVQPGDGPAGPDTGGG